MEIKAFFDEATYTLTFLVWDPTSKEAVVIDPVLDYDPLSSSTTTTSIDRVSEAIRQKDLKLRWVLETHAHADHLTGSQILKQRHQAKIAIGSKITAVQETFKTIFALDEQFATDGSQFDRLLQEGDLLSVGDLNIEVIETPGHTPACVSYKIGDTVFTGDALFMDDYGTGRCDFPKGNATDMYHSIHEKLYALPDNTRVFVGHDYLPEGRDLAYETTIGKSKERNPQLRQSTSENDFVRLRQSRDKTLSPPRLLFPSIQVNIAAGKLPQANTQGQRFLKIPLNMTQRTDDNGQKI